MPLSFIYAAVVGPLLEAAQSPPSQAALSSAVDPFPKLSAFPGSGSVLTVPDSWMFLLSRIHEAARVWWHYRSRYCHSV